MREQRPPCLCCPAGRGRPSTDLVRRPTFASTCTASSQPRPNASALRPRASKGTSARTPTPLVSQSASSGVYFLNDDASARIPSGPGPPNSLHSGDGFAELIRTGLVKTEADSSMHIKDKTSAGSATMPSARNTFPPKPRTRRDRPREMDPGCMADRVPRYISPKESNFNTLSPYPSGQRRAESPLNVSPRRRNRKRISVLRW